MSAGRFIVVGAVLAVIGAFFALGWHRYLSLDNLQSHRAMLSAAVAAHPVASATVYFVAYVAMAGLSLPGATILTLAGGAIFGFGWGLLLVSFASTLGATLAFLFARFLLRESVRRRFGARLAPIDAGMRRDGAFYLFAVRLVPAFPFFVVNLLMGLTPIRVGTYYWVSQVGMLPATVVYVYAGTQIGQLTTLAGILSPGLVGAFVLLAAFPFVARRMLAGIEARKVYARWQRPKRFDADLVVIGAGSAGLVTAYISAAVQAKVVLVERHRMGGDCLNTGCVPSKALIRSAKAVAELRRAGEFGIRMPEGEVDFTAVMARVRRVIGEIAPHDSVERYRALGVQCVEGEARLLSPWEVEVRAPDAGMRTLTARRIVIASGARPVLPPIPGLADAGPLTSENVWSLKDLPRRLVVLGGGPIGCELAQAFARLGAQVTLVEMGARLLPREDEDAAQHVAAALMAEGVSVLAAHRAISVEVRSPQGKALRVSGAGGEREVGFDEILVAVGRRANVEGIAAGDMALALTDSGTVGVNEFLETNFPNIYACGDVAGPFRFTHAASHMAWYAAVNALFGRFRRFRVDYSVIPWCTFTDPEVARVGLNEQEAREAGVAFESVIYGLDDLDRAIVDGEAKGFVKVLVRPGSDHILGATIVGARAGELIAEFVLALRQGIGLNALLGTIHVYPTWMEANKHVAGAWKRSTVTEGQRAFLAAFHRWQRGEAGLLAVIATLAGLLRPGRGTRL